MADYEDLKSIILSFRVSELQMLLGFAQRNKTGKKQELQTRALELLKSLSTPIVHKIKELQRSIQQQNQVAANGTNATPTTGSTIGKDISGPPILTPNMPQTPQTRSGVYHNSGYTSTAQEPRNPSNLAVPTRATGIMYPPQYPGYTPKTMTQAYPIHPDVKFKRLPFFDILGDLLKPSTLLPQSTQRMQECSFRFHLTPQQATDIASTRDIRNGNKIEYSVQVQLRFCLSETTSEQDDCFPSNVIVKVNNKLCPLPNPIPTNRPNVEPKRPPRPVNITNMVKLSPTVANNIHVSWVAEYAKNYTICCALVKKLSSSQLLGRLKIKGLKHSDYTRGLIKEKLNEDADCEIATTSLRVSLICPLGKVRMTTPCRASTCSHLQCFDASLYLQMNEKKATWMCPVCDKAALYDHLVIDGYFQEVLNSSQLPPSLNEIQLHKDGSWSTQIVEKKYDCLDTPSKPNLKIEVISDDIEVITVEKVEKSEQPSSTTCSTPPKEKSEKSQPVVDLTLSDSDDDRPLKRKVPQQSAKPDSTATTKGFGMSDEVFLLD